MINISTTITILTESTRIHIITITIITTIRMAAISTIVVTRKDLS